MSRWICIDDICVPSDENDWEELVAFADAIAEQEPIDIICCGECKYAEASVSPITSFWCTRFGINDMAMEDDDFCSYGEREGE